MASDRRSTARTICRVVRVVLWGMTAAHLLEALSLRVRRDQLEALPPPASPDGGPLGPGLREATGPMAARGVELRLVAGAWIDRPTLAGVVREMDETGVEVVDLVPGDLPPERALRVLRRVDPERLETDPDYAPGGAHQVLARRSGSGMPVPAGAGSGAASRPTDVAAMVADTVDAQRQAPTTAALRLAPGLRATAWGPDERWRETQALVTVALGPPRGWLVPLTVGLETAHLLTMTAGLLVAPVAALAALGTWSAQPALVFGKGRAGQTQIPIAGPTAGQTDGRPEGESPLLRPPGVMGASLLRLPRSVTGNLRTILAGYRAGCSSKRRSSTRLPAARMSHGHSGSRAAVS